MDELIGGDNVIGRLKDRLNTRGVIDEVRQGRRGRKLHVIWDDGVDSWVSAGNILKIDSSENEEAPTDEAEQIQSDNPESRPVGTDIPMHTNNIVQLAGGRGGGRGGRGLGLGVNNIPPAAVVNNINPPNQLPRKYASFFLDTYCD